MSELPRSQGVPQNPAGIGPGAEPATGPTTPVTGTGDTSTRPLPGTDPGTTTRGTTAPGTTGPGTTAPAKPLRTPTGTRASYTWLALTAAAIALVLLIIFILQNTQTVTVTFLWMSGSLPLAVALLIAGVATLILTLAVGAARILQLRRFSKRAAKRSNKLAAPKKA